jgi:putative ABC transport system ATP-binding protein
VRNRQIGFIFQAFNLIGDLTVYENVELPAHVPHGRLRARRRRAPPPRDGRARAGGDGAPHQALPGAALGGQQQRVAVARAVAGEPAILLADEPTGNLDSANGEAVMGLLQELHRGGATICMVTHDPRYAEHADRGVHLFDGRVVEDNVAHA